LVLQAKITVTSKKIMHMKPAMLLIALIISCSLVAQDDSTWKEASKESQAYHKYRQHLSYPSYSFDKINAMIRKQVLTDSEDNLVLKEKAYASLSLREKFTYNMIHAESYSQNCDAEPPIQEEQKKIFSNLPDAFYEYSWSERQEKFFTGNKDSVVALIKECVSKNNRIGVNFKLAIVEMNAREMIPFLIKIYNIEKKDHDILTLLMLLMKGSEYKPFLISASYKKLYGDDTSYGAYIMYSKANEDLILKRATDFYNEIKK
jgi:hypothetical protein